jgi:hypothetical protein
VNETREALLTKLGFRFGANGPHAARTMMLGDLRTLFAHVSAEASRSEYVAEVVVNNVLGKPSKKARELAARHLATLYALDPESTLFRALRRLWTLDELAQPVLALTAAIARDPLLRASQLFMLEKEPGMLVTRQDVQELLAQSYQDRFSPASLKSFAQNVNGTWSEAGYLTGRSRKTRVLPAISPANVAFCLFLGYLEGLSGQRLFSSSWMKLLPGSRGELEALASAASHRGYLVFMNAGGVQEVRFPGYLTAEEEQWRQEASRVV